MSGGLALLLVLGSLSLPGFLQAGENGGSLVSVGCEDFMAGALPPPGTKVFINYLQFYSADQLKDNNGNSTGAFRLNVAVDALRFIDVFKTKVLGADPILHVIIPVLYEHLDFSAGSMSIADQGRAGVGDIEFGTGLAYHPTSTFHHVLGLDAVAPTGQYQRPDSDNNNDIVNIGRNYWGLDPIWALTYLGDTQSPIPGLEASAKFMYWFNTQNSATDYRSGDEFSFDYLVGYHRGDWALGANGNYLYQTSDDVQSGHPAAPSGVANGNRGREFSMGPALEYKLTKALDATLKYQRDLTADNRPVGNHFWFKLICPF